MAKENETMLDKLQGAFIAWDQQYPDKLDLIHFVEEMANQGLSILEVDIQPLFHDHMLDVMKVG